MITGPSRMKLLFVDPPNPKVQILTHNVMVLWCGAFEYDTGLVPQRTLLLHAIAEGIVGSM